MHIKERRKNRLLNYNYSQGGWYFVTICTKNRVNHFGEICHDKMVLNKYGEIVEKQWVWLENQYKYVQLDEYIIMPNHIHGILVIKNDCDRRDRSRPVPTGNTIGQVSTEKIKSLSELMGAFKTTSSKLIHRNGLENFAWQRSFYDHIIRNEKSLQAIWQYIKNNLINWPKDRNNMDN